MKKLTLAVLQLVIDYIGPPSSYLLDVVDCTNLEQISSMPCMKTVGTIIS